MGIVPVISVMNHSTVVSDTDVKAYTAAIQKQLDKDFSAMWTQSAYLTFVKKPVPNSWWLAVLDDSDQAGALGYHDMSAEGLPLGKVFAKADIQDGDSVSVTMSHEILEMRLDPWINQCTILDNGTRLYALEVADACERDSYGYKIDGILVSDFVAPRWFQPAITNPAVSALIGKYDFMAHISKSFELLPGGYISYLDINSSSGWQQITADKDCKTLAKARAPIGSRRERRRIPRDAWMTSSIHV